MSRDPGLQPERTSIAWLRTQLVFCGMGLLMFKVGQLGNTLLLEGCGFLLLIWALLGVGYTQRRFPRLFRHREVVSSVEYLIKAVTSVIVALVAFSYFLVILTR